MELVLKGSQVFQLGAYFKDAEMNTQLKFSSRRKLVNFNKVLQPEFELIQAESLKIMKEYAEKDEKGNFKVENGNYVFNEKNQKKVKAELKDLENEEIKLEFEEFKLPEEFFDKFGCSADVIEVVEKNFLEE